MNSPAQSRTWSQPRFWLPAALLLVVAATVGLKWYSAWMEGRDVAQEVQQERQELLERIIRAGGTAVVAREPKWSSKGKILYVGGTVLLVDVAGDEKFGNADLKRLCSLAEPRGLNLMGTAVTDSGLKAIARLKHLDYLNLRDTRVTDAGIKHIPRTVGHLDLSGTNVTDAGINCLNCHRWLYSLWLGDTKITDEGVKSLRVRANVVSFANSTAGDSTLKYLRRTHLVDMHGIQITDAGLRKWFLQTAGSANVWWDLSGTAVTDEGVEYLSSSRTLLKLSLEGTDVREAAISELHRSLPECEINEVSPGEVAHSARTAAGLKLADMAVANTLVGRPVAEIADLLELGYSSPRDADLYAFDFGKTTWESPITLRVRTDQGYVISAIVDESTR